MDSEKRLGSEELVAALRKCGSVGAGCDGCPFEGSAAARNFLCSDALVRAAADRLEEYVDRCARFSEEIMVLRERLKKVEQPGGCAFAPWCDAVRERGRWIPVEERLPEQGERVLATDGGFVGEFYLNKQGQWQRYNVNDNRLLMALDILWWQPLPPAPEDAG